VLQRAGEPGLDVPADAEEAGELNLGLPGEAVETGEPSGIPAKAVDANEPGLDYLLKLKGLAYLLKL
jgi:hypothetical protein